MHLLQTKSLTLTLCKPGDHEDIIALERDPEVMRYLNGGHPVDRAVINPNQTFLMPEGNEPYIWTARDKTNSSFVGWFCLWPESESVAELGYRLNRQAWGQGFATEGTSALINWGFTEANYERIFASTMTTNQPSRRVLEKIGMTYVRTVQIDWPEPFPGTEEGEVEYEILHLARLRERSRQRRG
jgi:RimJ/RimL family protein N-acetyltransferase